MDESNIPIAMTALAGLIGGYYWVWSRSRFVRLIDALPGPNPLPLLGNLLHLLKFSPDEMLLGMNHRHPIYKMWISRFFPVVFIAHPELCKPILSSNKYVTRPREYLFAFSENSLPILTGKPWKKRRRMLNPAFHLQNLNGFVDIFNDLSLDCVAKIELIILGTASSSSGCQEIDVHPIMSLLGTIPCQRI
ncbi:cytochrome P450 4g15-like isoform X2 [Daphnia pulex]|uniref:cytochrome P450 4g15-like isoform X2 n=1 Tax=Daphnia pulex TaxID=6669 RepID=UPI001EDD5546|nr:cytochrome P450 4g15-like isoform X2 [Daphnia pulex]